MFNFLNSNFESRLTTGATSLVCIVARAVDCMSLPNKTHFKQPKLYAKVDFPRPSITDLPADRWSSAYCYKVIYSMILYKTALPIFNRQQRFWTLFANRSSTKKAFVWYARKVSLSDNDSRLYYSHIVYSDRILELSSYNSIRHSFPAHRNFATITRLLSNFRCFKTVGVEYP